MIFAVATNTDAEDLTYAWHRNGAILDFPPEQLSGATTKTLTINSVQETNKGNYMCVISNAHGSSISSLVAQLTLCEHSYLGV